MAAGQRAFTGATMARVLEAILNETTVPAHQFNSGVPRRLDRVITKALEKDRERRYQSAPEMRGDLARTAVGADTAIQAEVQVSTAESSLADTQPALRSPADEGLRKGSRTWRKSADVGSA